MTDQAKKILVIEDEEDINALITLNIQSIEIDNTAPEVTRCHDGREGYALAQNQDFDLLILDVMLPNMNGLEIATNLRSEDNHIPILMLTAKKSEADRVMGLEVGADDYLTKPFSVLELQARVKALLRRVSFAKKDQEELENENELCYGDLQIVPESREIKVGDRVISLTSKEFDLLLYLASFPGQVFSREQLLNAVWGYQHSGYEHTVNSHINRLRAKIEIDPSDPAYVLTVWGIGYKFNDK
ncbi:MAG: response regulator transcription factor [Agarilytica sp.]